jgi:hypothetical protein
MSLSVARNPDDDDLPPMALADVEVDELAFARVCWWLSFDLECRAAAIRGYFSLW